mmetsp:Transcript_38769/g.124274  ORF Transcript_38769/g.124274 Transcript_38769/m.124274 type:complete len:178 (+) Transcript_38769:10-543(+)
MMSFFCLVPLFVCARSFVSPPAVARPHVFRLQAAEDVESPRLESVKALFESRLTTLEHLLRRAEGHFNGSESFLQERLAADMLPFGTQIAFTCNQPRNFALWCAGRPPDNLDPRVTSLAQAYEHVATTKDLLAGISHVADDKLSEVTRLDLGQGTYLELSGTAYVDDFLMPTSVWKV